MRTQVGANMTTYLLEKSRIVYRGDQERNYHIFYALLTGAGDGVKKRLQLQQPTQYNYLNSSALVAPDTDDTAHFASALELMGVLGFTDEEQDHILRLVAAVLAIGNVEFAATDANNDSPKVANPAALQTAADLLQVNPTTLESALTHRTTTTSATESFKIALSISQVRLPLFIFIFYVILFRPRTRGTPSARRCTRPCLSSCCA